ncbi:alcohol dehydrogenase catalytic domain-containing protein [Actinoallomurus sp. NPDC052274]|uniref:alcohol dehydrogenase catalytic domain-containing protein n=1 Tax=Actinoallomurus sp. NPDC052274 TaxID=3155420 RepID=UPI00342ECDED
MAHHASRRGASEQRDRAAGAAGLTLSDIPRPHAAENDVIVRVHVAGFTPGELDWPGTWTDRAGRDRTPSVPGHELSGVVVELGYGTTGLTWASGYSDWPTGPATGRWPSTPQWRPATSPRFRPASTTPWPPPCPSPG